MRNGLIFYNSIEKIIKWNIVKIGDINESIKIGTNSIRFITGIVYGPVVGGIVGVASDLVGYLFSAQIYPPNPIVTLGAAMVGITAGVVAKYIVRKKGTVQIICSGISAHVIGSMIVKSFGLYQFYGALVLWRIPTYILISAAEITVICILLRRKSFATLIGYI